MEFFPEDQHAISISCVASSSYEIEPQNLSENSDIEGPSFEIEDATESDATQLEESCRLFSLAEILIMTNNFDDTLIVGTGGFGKVYKGFFDARIVAIKRLNDGSKQGAEEFWTEAKMLAQLQHTHLVALIGYCDKNQEMILVYEYIAHGNLANHLYKFREEESDESISFLTWEERLKICIGAARGLDYLHSGTNLGIIHRDVKSTNILLDENWVAKVSDFGLSKGITSLSTTHVSTKVKGTFGYLDPDYYYTNRITKKSDVYAFGVVLLEVLCGRPPVDTKLEEEQISLILWAIQYIKKGKLDRIIDPSMSGQITPNSLKQVAKLAKNCLHAQPKERPTMGEVVETLEIALASHERKRKSQGVITGKAFQGIRLVPKDTNLLRREGKGNNTKGGPTNNSIWQPLLDNVTHLHCRFSLAEIHSATNNFDESLLISRDGWFELYKGCIDGGNFVNSIKRFQESIAGPILTDVVSAEIQVQSLTRHPNMATLQGFCNEEDELILVYYDNFINGTLRSHLYKTDNDPLIWKKRLEICIDIARGLKYLHAGSELQAVIHRNIKTTNILLDNKWVAKVTDLSISKSLPQSSTSEGLETLVCSNLGYMDPEYVLYEKVTKKLDVYAFGVVLFEVLCAKEPYGPRRNEGVYSLVEWFKSCITKGVIEDVIDPYLLGKISPQCLGVFVKIALSCVVNEGIRRPSMEDVLRSLESALQLQEFWENLVETGVALPVTEPLSYNATFSLDSEYTIGGQRFLCPIGFDHGVHPHYPSKQNRNRFQSPNIDFCKLICCHESM